ncbi:MAG: hypothetical protein K5656_11570 [Lachnospiraceae bacterium]|nr:hypothetical protein [Lachnospiraceae bacterium]
MYLDIKGRHYGQILINYTVKDGTEKSEIDELAKKIKEFVVNEVDEDVVKDIEVRVNL